MREISCKEITEAVKSMCFDGATKLPEEALNALKQARKNEESEISKSALEQIVINHELAATEELPMCQDTGIAVCFVKLGREVHLDGDLYEAINKGVSEGYIEGYLRMSVVKSPITRINTLDNTPAIIHLELVSGDKIEIDFAPKGAGSENMSRLYMLKPSDGVEGIKKAVVETIFDAKGNPCPPIIVGVGIGGNFEQSAVLAKKALMRSIDDSSPIEENKKLEEELNELINKTGIGTMGLGGTITSLGVKVETQGCHIASLPVAINIQCHAARHKKVVI